jgi:C4-dicarboxylate-specific signal transduction histidine kinase
MRLKVLLIVFLLFVISLIVTLNLFFHQSYEAEMASQINKHQLIIANSIAENINDTFEHFKEEVVSFSNLLAYRGLEHEGLSEFVSYALAELEEEISLKLVVFDRNENMIFSRVTNGFTLGEDERFLLDAARKKTKVEPVIRDSSATDGTIKYSTPILKNGQFLGTVLMYVNIEDVNKKFLASIKHGGKGYAWVMDVYGTLIYHPVQPDMIGKNIFTSEEYCYKCHTSFKVEKEIIRSAQGGVQTYSAPYGEDKLLAFAHTVMPEWIVIVTMPYSEVTASIKNTMKLQSMIVLAIFILTVLTAFVIIIINRQRVNAEARASYADKVREYAKELESIVQERTRELRSEKEKLDAVIGSIEAGISIFDEKGACVWKNRVLDAWLSDEMKEHLTLKRLLEDSGVNMEYHEAVVEDRVILEVAHMDLGRKQGFFQIAITFFHTPDGHSQMLLLIQDITELKLAEEKLIQSEKIAALSRLSAGVAHEIGNPLTSISSYVQILDGMEGKDEFTSKTLEVISKNINRIVSIVKKMASFTKTHETELREHNVRDLLKATLDLVRYDRRSRNIELKLSVPDELNPVLVDDNQLEQIFLNIILNAIDAMSEGGMLEISAADNDGEVSISFKDTGSGIPPDQLEHVFEPFFTTKESGTGFGLSVSYSIIKSFGGEIDVQSSPGHGTTFTVRLPAHERKEIPVDGS